MYAPIFIGIAIVMIALGLLVSLIAGVRNLYIGKADFKKIITFAVPFVVFGIAYSSIGVAGDAAIATMVIPAPDFTPASADWSLLSCDPSTRESISKRSLRSPRPT